MIVTEKIPTDCLFSKRATELTQSVNLNEVFILKKEKKNTKIWLGSTRVIDTMAKCNKKLWWTMALHHECSLCFFSGDKYRAMNQLTWQARWKIYVLQ